MIGLSEGNGFGLLDQLGFDGAGAVVIFPADREPERGRGRARWLSELEIEERLRDVPHHPLGVMPGEGVPLSLGGVRQKLIVVRAANGQIGQPIDGAPSTHIINGPGSAQLAPLYDVVSTAVYPALTTRLAISVDGIEDPAVVDLHAWTAMLRDAGFGPQPGQLRREVDGVLGAVHATRAISQGWHRPIVDEIVAVAEARAAQLGRYLPLGR